MAVSDERMGEEGHRRIGNSDDVCDVGGGLPPSGTTQWVANHFGNNDVQIRAITAPRVR
jgi:hypothetical protein